MVLMRCPPVALCSAFLGTLSLYRDVGRLFGKGFLWGQEGGALSAEIGTNVCHFGSGR